MIQNDILDTLRDIQRRLQRLERLERPPSLGATVRYSGTPGAGTIAYWTGAGTIAAAGFGTADVARINASQTYSGTPTFSNGLIFAHETLNYYDEGTWTPSDASGAGLSFTSPTGRYTRIGRMVFAEFSLTFPTTANTANVTIGSLPFTPAALAGTSRGGGFLMVTNLGQQITVLLTSSGILLFDVSGNAFTNADLSTKLIRGTIIYTV